MSRQGSGAALSTKRTSAGGQVQADPLTDLAPYVPSASNPFDARKAAHLMRRAGFGARPEEIPAIVAFGVDRTIDVLLTPSTSPLQEYGAQVLPNGEILDLPTDLASQRAQWLHEMVTTRHPLKEKMALFWHDHFSVGIDNGIYTPLMLPHINIFRRHGLGSFRDMIVDVTRDPAMLYWLDNYLNGAGGRVNENYGRELLELYTMGVNGGYTQQDVYEASRVLSGWTLLGFNGFTFAAGRHLTGSKLVLGRTIVNAGQNEFYDMLDNAILPWPATAEFIVGKIWRYFVSENPDPALITELANRFRADRFNIRTLMSTILRSNYFFSDRAIGQLVKNPVEFAIGMIRNTNTGIDAYRTLGAKVEAMGYPLLRYANPSGLSDGVAWVDSSTLIARANLANELTMVSATTNGTIRARFDPTREIVQHSLTSAEAIVDHWLNVLVDGRVEDAVRVSLYGYMHRTDSGHEPFTFTTAKVGQKVRGLVHLILSLPEYGIN